MNDAAKQTDARALPNHHPRKSARHSIELDTFITMSSGLQVHVHLIDISPHGFYARAKDTLLARGESVRVILPMLGDVEASVMWSLPTGFGCRFAEPINARLYPILLGAIETSHADWPGSAG